MKQVQEALKGIGIPVMAGVWRATSANQNPPVQYAVYSTTTTEASHQDDMVTSYRTFVYLNLWSDIDPTETANRIRAAMYDAGFFMVEESDKGYNQPAYDTATTQFTVQWTWCLQTDVPLAIQEMIFGNQIDDNGVLVRTASDRPPYFAVGFKSEKSDGAFRYVWLYKGATR